MNEQSAEIPAAGDSPVTSPALIDVPYDGIWHTGAKVGFVAGGILAATILVIVLVVFLIRRLA